MILRCITFSKRYSENSSLNLELCVALYNAIWKSYAKNEEIYFSFFIYNNFSFNSNFTLDFFCGALQ